MKKWIVPGISAILITGMVLMSGCTGSPPASPPDVTAAPATGTTAPATTVQTAAPALTSPPVTVSTVTPAGIAVTGTPANDVLTVTLNSAEKKVSLGNGIGKPGRMLLLLDITIKNNDKKNDFSFTDSSFVISYKSRNDRIPAITSQYTKALANPLFMGTIPAGSTDDGKVLFGVNASSDTYTLSVVDPAGTVLGSIDTISVP